MTNERQQVIQKVAKLLNMTIDNGASEQEAMTAAEKAGDLMAFYNINIDELKLRNTRAVKVGSDYVKYGKNVLGSPCDMVIAKLCDCYCWGSPLNGKVYFFGLPDDTEIALYLHDSVINAIQAEISAFKASGRYEYMKKDGYHGKSIISSFISGMETRLCGKLREMVAQKNQAVQEAVKTGTGLIVLKQEQIKSEFDDLGMKLKSNYCYTRVRAADAYSAGSAAGDRVTLSPGLRSNVAGMIQ